MEKQLTGQIKVFGQLGAILFEIYLYLILCSIFQYIVAKFRSDEQNQRSIGTKGFDSNMVIEPIGEKL